MKQKLNVVVRWQIKIKNGKFYPFSFSFLGWPIYLTKSYVNNSICNKLSRWQTSQIQNKSIHVDSDFKKFYGNEHLILNQQPEFIGVLIVVFT